MAFGMNSSQMPPVSKEAVQSPTAKLSWSPKKKKAPPMQKHTLPNGKKPSFDYRGKKDNKNGTTTYC